MIVIVCGSRSFSDYLTAAEISTLLQQAIDASGFHITKVISGGARGIDNAAIRWAILNNVPYYVERATKSDWMRHGRGGGNIRNLRMADLQPPPQACLAIWDGQSNGTIDMLTIMRDRGRQWYLHTHKL